MHYNNYTDRSNLTRNQLLMWADQKMHPEIPLYNMAYTFTISLPLDHEHFQRAFQALLNSADVLRYTIQEIEGIPWQSPASSLTYHVPFLDFTQKADPLREAQRWVEKRAQSQLDLQTRLFETALLKIGEEHSLWFMLQHHLITDAWSWSVLYRRMMEFYRRALNHQLTEDNGQHFPQFDEYLREEKQRQDTLFYQKARQYWTNKLKQEYEHLPFYSQMPASHVSQVQRISYDLGSERTNTLREIVTQPGLYTLSLDLSLFVIVTVLVAVYLYRISGSTHISIGTAFHSRSSYKQKETIGLLMDVSVLHLIISSNDTFLSLLQKARKEILETMKYSPFTVSHSFQEKKYDVLLNYHNSSYPPFLDAPTRVHWLHNGSGSQSLEIQVQSYEGEGNILLDFDFHCDVFQPHQQQRAIEHFLNILTAFLHDRNTSIHQISLLHPEEQSYILRHLSTGQPSTASPEEQTILALFDRQAQHQPDSVAIATEDQAITYGLLYERAALLARYLRSAGIGPEKPVGLYLVRSFTFIIGVLGILKAGGTYVPIDPEYPQERVDFILQDSNITHLLTLHSLNKHLPPTRASLLYLDDDSWMDTVPIDSASEEREEVPAATAENIAYMTYTSGSTGTPLGVQVRHAGLQNYIQATRKPLHLTASDRMLQFASLSFDIAAEEIFTCLTAGATLVLRSDTFSSTAPVFLHACQRLGISVLDLPTAYWHELVQREHLEAIRTVSGTLRLIIIGGEKASAEHALAWQRSIGPSIRLLNTYGPTETTIASTLCEVSQVEQELSRTIFPIGKPIAMTQLFVLDAFLQPVPVGVSGELYIGGHGLARGYHARPELTACRFLPHPFSEKPGERLFRTGDMVRWLSNGMLEFLGRADRQVKFRGFRIELTEIETRLHQHALVQDAWVTLWTPEKGRPQLVAYVVLRHELKDHARELRAYLQTYLPPYMLPEAYVILPVFPLTPHGKVDFQSFPQPTLENMNQDIPYVAPMNREEQLIADIWQSALHIEEVGRFHNFFELGGHSLQLLQILAALRTAFHKEIALVDLFHYPTPQGLADHLMRSREK